MDEILERIKKLESFSNIRQQWNIIRDIKGESKEISEKEQEDIDEFNKEKTELINILYSKINNEDLKNIVNNVEEAKNHLLALRGMLLITKFDDIANIENDLKKFEISILKDLKNKTFDQEIEIIDADRENETLKKNKEKQEEKEEKEEMQDEDNEYKYPMQAAKTNIFTRIKYFFISRFGTKILEKQNKLKWEEELKITKRFTAGLEEQKADENMDKVVETKTAEKVNIDLKERVSVTANKNMNKPRAEWRNGNVVIIKENDEEQLEKDSER